MNDKSFVDSNIWLYAMMARHVEERRQKSAAALVSRPVRHVISEQVVSEVAANLLKKARLPDDALLPVLESLYERCQVIVPDLSLHRLALALRQRYGFSFWDSQIVAAARQAGCATLYSEDMRNGLVVDDGLTIVNPFTT